MRGLGLSITVIGQEWWISSTVVRRGRAVEISWQLSKLAGTESKWVQ